MYELLSGIQPEVVFIRLPIVAPQVKQLTASGLYAEAIQYGQKKIDETVMNVSILRWLHLRRYAIQWDEFYRHHAWR